MTHFMTCHVSLERAEYLAALVRARGHAPQEAWEQWCQLSEDDREFWRRDVYAVLARVDIEVDHTCKDRA